MTRAAENAELARQQPFEVDSRGFCEFFGLRRNQKWVRAAFLTNRRARAMSRVHAGVVAKRKQDGPDGRDQRFVVAARQVRTSNRSREQRVADEQVLDERRA